MLYAVVSFDSTDETDFVPVKWIAESIAHHDIQKVIESRELVKFYWPPWKNPVSVSRAKRNCHDAEIGWPTHQGRILSAASKLIIYLILFLCCQNMNKY